MPCLLDSADPRPLLPVIAVWGLIAWKLPPMELLILCAASGTATICRLLKPPRSSSAPGTDFRRLLRIARGMLLFALGWSCVLFVLSLAGSTPLEQAALDAAILSLRLLTVAILGLCLVSTASPRALSLALSWYLRPFFGKKVWEAALALGLMIHFLPMTLATLNQAREAVRLRLPRCRARQKIMLVVTVTLRRLAQKSWEQAVAVASRRLDRPEVWLPASKPDIMSMFQAVLLCLTSLGLLYRKDLAELFF